MASKFQGLILVIYESEIIYIRNANISEMPIPSTEQNNK